jgi:hypothetical protein
MGPDVLTMSEWSSTCTERSLTIAPIPASMMSVWSEHNASMTATDSEGLTSRTVRLPSITKSQPVKTIPPLSGLPSITGLPTTNFVVTLGGAPTASLRGTESAPVASPNAGASCPSGVGRCLAALAAIAGFLLS